MDKPDANGPVSSPVIIAGAGIGGLTAALCLTREGMDVIVCERERELTEAGAGLQLSPNATRILNEIGVLARLQQRATPVSSIDLASAASGKVLLSLPTAKVAGISEAPYLAVHRADLQSALLDQTRQHPKIKMLVGYAFQSARQDKSGVEAEFIADNKSVHLSGSALIGADGVWSLVRNHVDGAGKVNHSGYSAWRATVPVDQSMPPYLLQSAKENRVCAFLASGAHLVVYPLRHGSVVNLVLIARAANSPSSYNNAVETPLSDRTLSQFEPAIKQMLKSVSGWRSWPLNYVAPGGRWTDGKIALLGDAAHAMTPFAAQGAAMAIEDAAVLARALSSQPDSVEAALATYAITRRARVARVAARGRFNRFAYHLSGPPAVARNLVFKLRGEALVRQLDWLYGFDVYT